MPMDASNQHTFMGTSQLDMVARHYEAYAQGTGADTLIMQLGSGESGINKMLGIQVQF